MRALWTACVDACRHLDGARQPGPEAPEFHRELLLACTNEDANDLVHTTLIPLCASFLDRGQSHVHPAQRAVDQHPEPCSPSGPASSAS